MDLYEKIMINMSNEMKKRYAKDKSETEFFEILTNSKDCIEFITHFVDLEDFDNNTETIFNLRGYYELYHSIVFKSTNDICKKEIYNIPENFLKGLERYDQRVMFTFEFDDIFIRLRYDKSKEVNIDGKKYKNTIDVLYNISKGNSSIDFSLLIVPEKYPSVYLYEFDDGYSQSTKIVCEDCNICRKCSMYCTEQFGDIFVGNEEVTTLRRIPRNLLYTGLSNCGFKALMTTEDHDIPMFEYPIRNVLDICLHTLNEYISKENKYKTKHSVRSNKLAVDFNDDNGLVIRNYDTVKINLFKEESKPRTSIDTESTEHNYPAHHKSPREHIRKSHYRHYKSGKVVKVRSSIVNMNNKQLKYEIK